ncbi:MAG: Serine/threonine-protein phosphatase 2A activator 1 [Sclerophora amabilis]|nr:MAG: Serine/threonine-protein phosphatase 2A activator 1 [Sclerophora amabilis]
MSSAHEAAGSSFNPPQSKLERLDPTVTHRFVSPTKRINDGEDVSHFLVSKAYNSIMTFLFQLNEAMFPHQPFPGQSLTQLQVWEIGSSQVTFSETVHRLREMLQKLESIIDEAPPDPGPRRFGNVSFKKWYQIVESRLPALLEECLPQSVYHFGNTTEGTPNARDELAAYLMGSFGSSQRLDYGTGHELSFLAFVGCIWMLGGFHDEGNGNEERGIVLGVLELYLSIVRRLIKTYTLEPAGSHGVWGLDDHSFVPYIFGSAQFSPAVRSRGQLPTEGSLPDAPDPGDVAKGSVVEKERKRNMYFGAVGFIYDVKKGPFWEHSPILFDISGVRAGWAKINKGMIKMYSAEVLSKFPVVQHFLFGSLFSWERDPTVGPPATSLHASSQPPKTTFPASQAGTAPHNPPSQEGTKAPWAGSTSAVPLTRAGQTTPRTESGSDSEAMQTTKAPWAVGGPRAPSSTESGTPSTRAPWVSAAHSGLPRPTTVGTTKNRGRQGDDERQVGK